MTVGNSKRLPASFQRVGDSDQSAGASAELTRVGEAGFVRILH